MADFDSSARAAPACIANAYFDGELLRVMQLALERQLKTDAALRLQVADLVQIRDLLRLAYERNAAD